MQVKVVQKPGQHPMLLPPSLQAHMGPGRRSAGRLGMGRPAFLLLGTQLLCVTALGGCSCTKHPSNLCSASTGCHEHPAQTMLGLNVHTEYDASYSQAQSARACVPTNWYVVILTSQYLHMMKPNLKVRSNALLTDVD
jgi:hypothetical protein